MKLITKCLLLAASVTFVAGLRAQDAVPAPPPAAQSVQAGTAPDYRLSANDLIFVKVFQEDDLNSTLRVAEDGSIIFPLIGSVKVGGQTVAAATGVIRDRLNERFLRVEVVVDRLETHVRQLRDVGEVKFATSALG